MAFKAIYGTAGEQELKADYQSAVKFGTFRIGEVAMYFPSFPTGAKYIPLTELDSAWVQRSAMSPKGCCGGQIPVFILHVRYGNEFYQNLTFEKEQDAKRALDLLRERRPELPGAPEEASAGKSIL